MFPIPILSSLQIYFTFLSIHCTRTVLEKIYKKYISGENYGCSGWSVKIPGYSFAQINKKLHSTMNCEQKHSQFFI